MGDLHRLTAVAAAVAFSLLARPSAPRAEDGGDAGGAADVPAEGQALAARQRTEEALTPVMASAARVAGVAGELDWRALSEVAEAARAAALARARGEVWAWAWGEPAMGCFVLVVQVSEGGARLHRALRDALGEGPADGAGARAAGPAPGAAAEGASRDREDPTGSSPDELIERVEIDDWQLDEAEVPLRSRFRFRAASLRGAVRTVTTPVASTAAAAAPDRRAPGTGVTTSLACFYGEREPALSEHVCERLLPALEGALIEEASEQGAE